MYVGFGSKMPRYLEPGATTPIYLKIVNDTDYKVHFDIDYYYSIDRRTWNKFAHEDYSIVPKETLYNLETDVLFTMPDVSEVMLGVRWKARKVYPDGTIGEIVDSGEEYYTIYRQTTTVSKPEAEIREVKVIEWTSGKIHTAENGREVPVNENKVLIEVTVENVGKADGTIFVDCLVDGVSQGIRSKSLSRYSKGTVSWLVKDLTPGRHTVIVRAGH